MKLPLPLRLLGALIATLYWCLVGLLALPGLWWTGARAEALDGAGGWILGLWRQAWRGDAS